MPTDWREVTKERRPAPKKGDPHKCEHNNEIMGNLSSWKYILQDHCEETKAAVDRLP